MSSKKCQICDLEFNSEKGLHLHVSRAHKTTQKDYYHKFFPRKNLLTGRLVPFKNKKDYFSRDFANRPELIKWCDNEDSAKVKPYILSLLKKRIDDKSLEYAPNHLEMMLHEMPTVNSYVKIFGSYANACKLLDIEPLFTRGISENIFDNGENFDSMEILADTREQKPLSFPNQESLKLDFGDYTVGGEFYSNTYIDRKSEGDFKTTLSQFNLDRFDRELERAREFDSYLYIVVESSIPKIKLNNNFKSHKYNLHYIFHNMRVMQHKFRGNCQFLFTGGRAESEKIIPILLAYGNKLWDVDLQYYIDKYGINC
jgi:hypothetical protein